MNRYGRHTPAAFDAQMGAPLPALDAAAGPQDPPKVLRRHEDQDSRGLPDVSRSVDRLAPQTVLASAQLPGAVPGRPVLRPHSSRTSAATQASATTHNARHQRAQDPRGVSASVPRVRDDGLRNPAIFQPNLTIAAVRKTVIWCERKSGIRQVLISRILSACGEVAEWPKPAVC